jgi:hypothetical protein
VRKAVKIKAITVFLAWMVIFAHSIIPHNHLQDDINCCSELIHQTANGLNSCDFSLKYENLPEETNVCHFSNLLFNHFGQDNLIITTNREPYYYPGFTSLSVIIHSPDNYFSEPYFGATSLRAPPSA